MISYDDKTWAQMPTERSLLELLRFCKGLKAYIVPMRDSNGRMLGNNGDRLMNRVFLRRLDALQIKSVDRAEAELVIVPPNGALLESYKFPVLLKDRLRGLEHLPLVIFPSSALFPTMDPAFIFEGRRAETLWVLREPRSFEHLGTAWKRSLADHGVRMALDHDVVAAENSYIERQFPKTSDDNFILVGARLDREARHVGFSAEAPSGVRSRLAPRVFAAGRRLPQTSIQTAINRMAKKRSSIGAGALIEDRYRRSCGSSRVFIPNLRRKYIDCSSPMYATYPEFLELIAKASFVISDRLHIALPAALLGKPTIMAEAGYHKLGGVYYHSLQSLPNLSYIES